jgi:competence ComEA-like helix-hairpin-helix protein
MKKTKLSFLLIIASLSIMVATGSANAIEEDKMHVHFINVGQGDATLLEFPCGVALVDTGGEIEDMLDKYETNESLLDVDIYHVGHHGSHNATTLELLEKMSPEIAVISMGPPLERRQYDHTAYKYGHPRKDIVDMLEENVSWSRDELTVGVAVGQEDFVKKEINKAIYATGWDDNIIMEIGQDGHIDIQTHAQGAVPTSSDESSLLNINNAILSELEELPMIGTVKALSIILYREIFGDFETVDDLINVYGIGPEILEAIRPYITV